MSFSWNIALEGCQDLAHNHLLESLIRKELRKMKWFQVENPFSLLPSVEVEQFPKDHDMCCVTLISHFFPGLERFFSEMLARSLPPGKKMVCSFFIHTVFSFAEDELARKLSFCQIHFFLPKEMQQAFFFQHFPHVAEEIKLGATSPYQMQKILEHRGIFSSGKHLQVQERLSFLIHKMPKDFDDDLLEQMQRFFLSTSEDFKQIREHSHLSRIIYVFYLFRKKLKNSLEKNPERRFISLKFSFVRLHRSLGFQKVLGVLVGITLLKQHEIFEEQHLIRALQECLTDVDVVEGSLFIYMDKEEKIPMLYLEIYRRNGNEFSFAEVEKLRKKLPEAIELQVEKLMPALFMPRNEEEVMKNIVRLSQELKYVKDIPQVFISFEEQTDIELTFTIVLVRILHEDRSSIQTLFQQAKGRCIFLEDRVKKVGVLRGKYPKEATVFRLKLPKISYIRSNRTVDLLKARSAVSQIILDVVGEFRDYNGGMIAQQMENFQAFKGSLPDAKEMDAENFFHGLYPVEMRSLVNPSLLKIFYEKWKEVVLAAEFSSIYCSFQEEQDAFVTMVCFQEEEVKSFLAKELAFLELRSSEFLSFSFRKEQIFYQGYLFLGNALQKIHIWKDSLEKILCQYSSLGS